MKNFLLLLIVCFVQNILAQQGMNLDPYDPMYDEMKSSGQIVFPNLPSPDPELINSYLANNELHPTVIVLDGLLIPLDGSFTVAMGRNDDGYTAEIPLQFGFQFYDQMMTSLYINNNGNLSFGSPYWTYTPYGFPVEGYPMVAPFWADVDTRPTASGLVYFRSEPHRFIVTWDHVGYYDNHTDKLNTFQVIITDGSDPLIGVGNNVAFSYAEMQWTTGDASGGSGGFGGVPATAGINRGNGTNFAQIGRFDHPGFDYDGPYGNSDGVYYLDDKTFTFNTGSGQGQQSVLIEGTLLDNNNLTPINGAKIEIPISNITTYSNIDGEFIVSVISNASYNLDISADNYLPKSLLVQVLYNNINVGIKLLEPLSMVGDFDVIELSPSPNKATSDIDLGGECFRYYQVIDEFGNGRNGINVGFERRYQSGYPPETFNYTSQEYDGKDGIIVFNINYDDVIPPYSTYDITSINNQSVFSPISFSVYKKSREYNKSFEVARDFKLGLGIASVWGGNVSGNFIDQSTAKLNFAGFYDGATNWDKVGININYQSGVGVEIGWGGGLKIGAGPVTGGVYGGSSTGFYAIIEGDGNYLYDYESSSVEMNRARLGNFLLSYISLYPNPVLSRFATILSQVLYENYIEDLGVGVGVKGVGSADVTIGAFTTRQIGLGFGAGANISGEIGGIINERYYKQINRNSAYLSLFGKVNAGFQAGIFEWGYKNPGNPNFNTVNKVVKKSDFCFSWYPLDMNKEFDISIYKDIGFGPTLEYSYLSESLFNKKGRELKLSFTHPDLNTLLSLQTTSPILYSLYSLANPTQPFNPLPNILNGFLGNNDDILIYIQNGQQNFNYPPIYYSLDTLLTGNSGDFGFSLDLAFGLDINFALGISWKTTRYANIEEGAYLSGIEYPIKKNLFIPDNGDIPLNEIKKIFYDGLSTYNLYDFFNLICFFCNKSLSDTTFQLSENGSTLIIDPSSIPPELLDSLKILTWSWYGNSPSAKLSDLSNKSQKVALTIKNRQQELENLEYGIGGFYNFQPSKVPLTSPATLTIAYSDSEIVGQDENNLAIFYQDSDNQSWKYLGGLKDTTNNSITASIDTLRLFTIAPILPDGIIEIQGYVDSLENNFSILDFWAENLILSNGVPVGNGKLYTVYADICDIIAVDMDENLPGIQISTFNSRIDFQIKSTKSVGSGQIIVESVEGRSIGSKSIRVVDHVPPEAAVITNLIAGDSFVKLVISNPDTSEVAQYEVYYDIDTGIPYNGTALPGGENSPFIVNASDTVMVPFLRNNLAHYFAVKSIDGGSNYSGYSNELSATPIDTIPPSAINYPNISIFQDSLFLIKWIASGDNYNYGRATKYYIKISSEVPIDTINWWSNALLIPETTSPNFPGSEDQISITRLYQNYHLGIMVEDEVGNTSPISFSILNVNTIARKLSLSSGWSLISLPVQIDNLINTLTHITSDIFGYEINLGYTVADSLESGKGYWIKSGLMYDKLLVGGLNDTTMNVSQGWNLIGSSSYITTVNNIISVPPNLINSFFFSYDSTGYSIADSVKPGKGHWVKCGGTGTIIFSTNGENSKKANIKDFKENISFKLANGIVKDIYIVDQNLVEQFDAPPIALAGPDIRFSTQRIGESESASDYEVLLTNIKFPVEISLIGKNEYEIIGNTTQRNYGKLCEGNALLLDEPENSVTMIKSLIPVDYFITQNYPNPFNPITTIKYGLPYKIRVTIKVFDILGQEVKRLLDNQEMEAGIHSLTWEASNFASGVYIYQINAGDFIETKKMVLIK